MENDIVVQKVYTYKIISTYERHFLDMINVIRNYNDMNVAVTEADIIKLRTQLFDKYDELKDNGKLDNVENEFLDLVKNFLKEILQYEENRVIDTVTYEKKLLKDNTSDYLNIDVLLENIQNYLVEESKIIELIKKIVKSCQNGCSQECKDKSICPIIYMDLIKIISTYRQAEDSMIISTGLTNTNIDIIFNKLLKAPFDKKATDKIMKEAISSRRIRNWYPDYAENYKNGINKVLKEVGIHRLRMTLFTEGIDQPVDIELIGTKLQIINFWDEINNVNFVNKEILIKILKNNGFGQLAVDLEYDKNIGNAINSKENEAGTPPAVVAMCGDDFATFLEELTINNT